MYMYVVRWDVSQSISSVAPKVFFLTPQGVKITYDYVMSTRQMCDHREVSRHSPHQRMLANTDDSLTKL